MKGMLVIALIIVAWIISFVVGEYDAVIGEILGMAMIQPFLLILLLIVFLIAYKGWKRIFNKGRNTNKIDKIIEKEEEPQNNLLHDNGDLYLVKNILYSEVIEYRIENKEKLLLWLGRCNLSHGKIHSITLYSGHITKEIALQVVKKPMVRNTSFEIINQLSEVCELPMSA